MSSDYLPENSQQYEETVSRMDRGLAWLERKRGFESFFTGEDALKASRILNVYPGLSRDLVGALAMEGLDADSPLLYDLAERDHRMQDTTFLGRMRQGSRFLFTAAESLWESGIPTTLRTATRIAQGENPLDAYKVGSVSQLSLMTAMNSLGIDYEQGTGWMPQSTPLHERPGYRDTVERALMGGETLATAYATADAEALKEWGVPLDQMHRGIAESTLLNKTINGVTYSSPVSLGRGLAFNFFIPGTLPYNIISAPVDFTTRIWLDPIDVGLNEWNLYRKVRNRIMPEQLGISSSRHDYRAFLEDNSIYRKNMQGKAAGTHWPTRIDPATGRTIIELQPEAMMLREAETALAQAEEALPIDQWFADPRWTQADGTVKRFADDDPNPHIAGRVQNPYVAGMEDVGITPQQFGELLENYPGGPAQAMDDLVLEHELIHRDVQFEQNLLPEGVDVARHNEIAAEIAVREMELHGILKELDEIKKGKAGDAYALRVDRDRLDSEIWQLRQEDHAVFDWHIERHAERESVERLMRGEMQATEWRQQAAATTNRRVRRFSARTADEWMDTRRGQRFLRWIAETREPERIISTLGEGTGISTRDLKKLIETNDINEVREVMRHYLGIEMPRGPTPFATPLPGRLELSTYVRNKLNDPNAGGVWQTFGTRLFT